MRIISQVERVLIFEKSGVPRVMFDFTDNKLIVDEILLSGFLSAIDGFSENLFQNPASHFVIDHGGRKITLFRSKLIVVAMISNDNLLDFKNKMDDLLTYFEQEYVKEDEFPNMEEEYLLFKVKLIRTLFHLPIAQDWIPVFSNSHFNCANIIKNYATIGDLSFCASIDGKNNIGIILTKSSFSKNELYEFFNFLAYEKQIEFTNILESRDYIMASDKLIEALHGNSILYQEIDKIIPLDFLQPIADQLEYYSSIHSLEECSEYELLPYFKILLTRQYINLIDEDRRGILVIQDLVADFLNILYQVDKEKIITEQLKTFINNLSDPNLKMRFQTSKSPITIRKFHKLPHLFEKINIDDLKNKWVSMLKEIINLFYQKYQKKINETFYGRLMEHYLNYLHDEDLTLLEPILFQIESACI